MGEYYPLKQLKVLKLNNNQLKVLHQNTFEHVKQIERLQLGFNPFDEIGSSTQNALKTLKRLQYLDLAGCNLETLPDDLFSGQNKKLESLDLSENLFLHIPTAILKVQSLEVLFFNANPILELRSSR